MNCACMPSTHNPAPTLPDKPICRMTTIKVLVVTITDHLPVSDHVRDVIVLANSCTKSSTMSRHERRSITACLQSSRHRQASVCIPSLVGYTTAAKSILRRLFDEEFDSDCTRLTTRRQQLADNNDDNLFRSLLTNGHQVLKQLLPDKTNYQ